MEGEREPGRLKLKRIQCFPPRAPVGKDANALLRAHADPQRLARAVGKLRFDATVAIINRVNGYGGSLLVAG